MFQMMQNAFMVFLGGGSGAVCRWLLAAWITGAVSTRFPVGILCCNVLGSLLIGFLSGHLLSRDSPFLSPLLITGFLGAFTTFSTFTLDTQKLHADGLTSFAIANVAVTLLLTLGAVWLGLKWSQ